MAAILKTLAFPVLLLLPWALVTLNENEGETFVQNFIHNDPILLFVILLPSIIIITGWVFKLLKERASHK